MEAKSSTRRRWKRSSSSEEEGRRAELYLRVWLDGNRANLCGSNRGKKNSVCVYVGVTESSCVCVCARSFILCF